MYTHACVKVYRYIWPCNRSFVPKLSCLATVSRTLKTQQPSNSAEQRSAWPVPEHHQHSGWHINARQQASTSRLLVPARLASDAWTSRSNICPGIIQREGPTRHPVSLLFLYMTPVLSRRQVVSQNASQAWLQLYMAASSVCFSRGCEHMRKC